MTKLRGGFLEGSYIFIPVLSAKSLPSLGNYSTLVWLLIFTPISIFNKLSTITYSSVYILNSDFVRRIQLMSKILVL